MFGKMNITSAVYTYDDDGARNEIKATIDGVEMHIPLVQGNRHYDEIMRQVEAGELTIEDAANGT